MLKAFALVVLLGASACTRGVPADAATACWSVGGLGGVGYVQATNRPLSNLLDHLTNKTGAVLKWRGLGSNTYELTSTRRDAFTGRTFVLRVELVEGAASTAASCGPRTLVTQRVSINGEPLSAYAGSDLLLGLLSATQTVTTVDSAAQSELPAVGALSSEARPSSPPIASGSCRGVFIRRTYPVEQDGAQLQRCFPNINNTETVCTDPAEAGSTIQPSQIWRSPDPALSTVCEHGGYCYPLSSVRLDSSCGSGGDVAHYQTETSSSPHSRDAAAAASPNRLADGFRCVGSFTNIQFSPDGGDGSGTLLRIDPKGRVTHVIYEGDSAIGKTNVLTQSPERLTYSLFFEGNPAPFQEEAICRGAELILRSSNNPQVKLRRVSEAEADTLTPE